MIRRRGFTLVELVLACAITAVILMGLQSAMLIAARAAPGRTGLTEQTLAAGRATDQLSADIACATAFSILGPGSIEMTVPDRTGDGLAEKIRYAWSGNSGDSLLRTMNGGAGIAVAADVRQFSLDYVKSAAKQPTSYTESAESVLLNTDTGSSTYPTVNVTTNGGISQSFLSSAPASASYIRVTRADFFLKSSSPTATSEVRAQLRSGTTVYAIGSTISDYSKIFAPSLSASWIEATFPQNVQLAPGSAISISLIRNGNSNDFVSAIRSGTVLTNCAYGTSADGGNSWSSDSSKVIPAYVYGVYGNKNADAYTYNLTHVTCTMKCGNSAIAQIHSDWRALNAPQVSGP